MNGEPLVLVLTMGRVGSTATSTALVKAGVNAGHIHHLNPRTLAALTKPGKTPPHVDRGWAAHQMVEADPERPVKIISLVRDPVERNLSAGFARFRKRGDVDVLAADVADPEATGRIWRNLDTTLPGRWFDDEIRDVTGIDVYAEPFPEAGYARYEVGRFELLVMHSGIADTMKSEQVTQLLDLEVTVGRNDSQTRDGGVLHDIYRRFEETVPWTREDLWNMVGSKYGRHFFDYGAEADQDVHRLAERLAIP